MLADYPILIVDDNVNLARGFALALQRNGYRVNIAHTAAEGNHFRARRTVAGVERRLLEWCVGGLFHRGAEAVCGNT